MFRISEPAATPSRSSTIRALLLLLLLALIANSVATALAIHDYYVLDHWLVDPASTNTSEIVEVQRQMALRTISRLVVSAALVLSAIFFVLQRRRSVSMHEAFSRVQRLAHNVLDSMVQGVIAVDGQGIVREINPAAVRLLGADPNPAAMEAMVGHPVEEMPVAGAELGVLVREAASRAEPIWDRELTVGRDGLTLRLRADAQTIKSLDGSLGGCILLLRDQTRLLLVEERMRRMERIAGLGDAATGLVHEIKNPLTALSIHIQLLEERLTEAGPPAETAELIGALKAEADRLNNVLDGFWNYARLEGLAVEPTDAIAILERVVQLIRPQAERQGVLVELRRPTGPTPSVLLDPERFQQAVWNLAINALEAMPEGGELVVEAEDHDGTFSVAVRDTGPGIPAEIRGDIFKPYFSTKSRGTGLGLALTEKVVGQHNGGIACRTGPGGTAFELAFPLTSRHGEPDDDGNGRRPVPHPDRG
jgi:signal transduction histidine kinase